jgi:negative regulator of genetic competence, sporulation and motility
MLTQTDLDGYGVCTEDLDYANTETKRMLWDILNTAKREVRFNTDGQRVLLQLFPSRDGGCEIFVCKLGALPLEDAEHPAELLAEPILHCKRGARSSHADRTGAFRFERLDSLLTVCHRLFTIGYGGKSSAFVSDDKYYYLLLDGMDTTGYLPVDEFSFIREYGTSESTECTRHFLSEHGRAICEERAVDILGAL